MRRFPAILLSLAMLVLGGASALAESTAELLNLAQTAYLKGDLETAKKYFSMVSEVDSRNVTAIAYLRRIQAEQARKPAENKIEKQLQAVILPKVEFRQATMGSALEYLKQQVSKITEEKLKISFVVTDPAINEAPVSLSLTTIPAAEVLRYLGEMAKVKFSYESHAIVVRPIAAAK